VVADWTNPIVGRFDLIISNPPYIRRSEINTLMPDVARHEPRRALDGGADGYDAYRVIVPRILQHLEPDGCAILEVGAEQASYVKDLALGVGLQASHRLDLAGIPRAIIVTYPSC
jgi:release factor glutamine methyltransferase